MELAIANGRRVIYRASKRPVWRTPEPLYESLNNEFHFTLDPCQPGQIWDGRLIPWIGERVYCNPPYSNIGTWLLKAREAEIAVYLLPSRYWRSMVSRLLS